MIKQRNDQH